MIEAIGLFDTMTKKLNYVSVRHTILAQNVANADTPDFRAKDLKPFAEAMRATASGQLAGTDALHMEARKAANGYREDHRFEGWELEPSGNSVSLEEQMIEAADAARDYQLTTTLINKHLAMLRASMRTTG